MREPPPPTPWTKRTMSDGIELVAVPYGREFECDICHFMVDHKCRATERKNPESEHYCGAMTGGIIWMTVINAVEARLTTRMGVT